MPLFPGERYAGPVRKPSAEHRRTVFAASVLLHSAALFWLMTSRTTMVDREEEPPPLMTIDLPQREPEVARVPEDPAIVQLGSPDSPKQGGGGGQLARALLAQPTIEPASLDISVPAVVLEAPFTVPLPAAPVTGPALIGSGGADVGVGNGNGVGNVSGKGSGYGTGSGKGDGAGTGRGGTGRRAGPGAGLLQPAEWIVRPSDEVMRAVYPWNASTQGGERDRALVLQGQAQASARLQGAQRKPEGIRLR